MKQFVWVAVMICLFSTMAHSAENREASVSDALELLGFQEHFIDLHDTINRGINQSQSEGVAAGQLSYAELKPLVDKYFDPQLLQKKLAESLFSHYDVNRFNHLLASLRSEQIQDIRLRIMRAAAADNLKSLQYFAGEYNKNKVDQQKKNTIEGLERAGAGNELYAGIQALSTLTMLRLQEVQQGISPQFSEKRLLQQLYMDYLESGRYTTEMIYLFALSEQPIVNLQLSLRVYRSTAVQWFLGAAVDNLITIVEEQRVLFLMAISPPENMSLR